VLKLYKEECSGRFVEHLKDHLHVRFVVTKNAGDSNNGCTYLGSLGGMITIILFVFVVVMVAVAVVPVVVMEQHDLKNVNNCLNTNIYSYLETSGGQSANPYLNVVHFSTPVLIRNLWQLKTAVFLHWCLIHALRLLPKELIKQMLVSAYVNKL
jgi:hypothetical protein